MTDRQRALLACVGAQLELRRAEQALKGYLLAEQAHLSTATVYDALRGANLRLTTLVALAEALDCDVVVELRQRVA